MIKSNMFFKSVPDLNPDPLPKLITKPDPDPKKADLQYCIHDIRAVRSTELFTIKLSCCIFSSIGD
jgi:hypothetical protein